MSFGDIMEEYKFLLRQKAEDIISGNLSEDQTLTQEEITKIIHELRVHQIELEIQNEELRNTQEKLQKTKEEFAFLYDNAPFGYITIDKSAMILRSNKTFRQMIEYQDDLLNKSLIDFIYDEDRIIFTGRYNVFYKNPEGKFIDIRLKRTKNNYFYARISGRVEKPNQAKDTKLLVNIIDVSEQKVVEQQLLDAKFHAEESNKAKSIFLSNMSHEIRTPMNAVLGYADLLSDTALDESQKEYIDIIKQSGESLLVIINDILDISRIESGKMSIIKKPFNLENVIKSTVERMVILAERKNLKLSYHISDIKTGVIGDPYKIEQVMLNLIGNAVKFTDKGNIKVFVNILDEDNETIKLNLIVEDTGIGIPENMLDRIFEHFKQIDEGYSKQTEGSGLGLTIARSLVELMGGSIVVSSTIDKGSRFTVTIPFAKAEMTKDVVPESLIYNNKQLSKRILIVEDILINQKLILHILNNRGFNADIVDNGEEALKTLETGVFDIILMDLHMPGIDGFETVKKIRERETVFGTKKTIIALTANALKESFDRCKESGFNDYITKPINIDSFYKVLEKYL